MRPESKNLGLILYPYRHKTLLWTLCNALSMKQFGTLIKGIRSILGRARTPIFSFCRILSSLLLCLVDASPMVLLGPLASPEDHQFHLNYSRQQARPILDLLHFFFNLSGVTVFPCLVPNILKTFPICILSSGLFLFLFLVDVSGKWLNLFLLFHLCQK